MAVDHLNDTFSALADPTRRAILARLADGEATVNELADIPGEPPGGLEALEGVGAGRPHHPRTLGPVATVPSARRTAEGRHRLVAGLPAVLGSEVRPTRRTPAPDPGRSRRRPARSSIPCETEACGTSRSSRTVPQTLQRAASASGSTRGTARASTRSGGWCSLRSKDEGWPARRCVPSSTERVLKSDGTWCTRSPQPPTARPTRSVARRVLKDRGVRLRVRGQDAPMQPSAG